MRVDSLELDRVKEEVAQILPSLGKHKIEEIMGVIDEHYERRFEGKRRIPEYGNLNKDFADNQIEAFFRAVGNEKHRLLLSYQANLGLRVGEVVKISLKDINMQTRELTVFTEKAKTIDTLIIPIRLFEETQTYINCFSLNIKQAQGYIFFRDPNKSNRTDPYLEPNYVRKVFRHYVQEARLDEDAYGLSDEDRGRTQKQLHRLTTHSLRHYAITRFAKQVNGNLVLARAGSQGTLSRALP